jgi:hypothetical protein
LDIPSKEPLPEVGTLEQAAPNGSSEAVEADGGALDSGADDDGAEDDGIELGGVAPDGVVVPHALIARGRASNETAAAARRNVNMVIS